MSEPTTAPYGAWRSPITADLVARSEVSLAEPWPDGDASYWLEMRPSEDGRYVVVCGDPHAAAADVTPTGFNARTKVHEYGGGSFWVYEGTVFFANFEDQRLYRQEVGGAPAPITPASSPRGSIRYADGRVTPDGRHIVCVRERHEGREVTNELVVMPLDGSREPSIVAAGRDFFSFPRASPDGRQLAWTCWDHPRMPWDGTGLWVADLSDDGLPQGRRLVAGGPAESIFQPEWNPDGVLHFVSDRSGWWNLYRELDGGIEALHPMEAEFGRPQWEFGYSTYAFLADGRLACLYTREGEDHLAMLDPDTSELLDLELPFTCFQPYLRGEGTRLVFVAGDPATPNRVVSLDSLTRAVGVLRVSAEAPVDPGFVSVPRAIEFPSDGGLTAHALFYPPANPDYVGPEDERPPLVVMSHGGPTSHVTAGFDLRKQFFTSRGLAVVDVNYGGSTGYGREFRDRLRGQWGIVDTRDCINAARYLSLTGEVDGDRLAIRGGSAGGYTTLCALTFHDDFAVGASYFGLADLEPFAKGTHKFESRYLDGLVGPWPEAAGLWRARSPVNYTDLLSCPVILLQGLEDEVVPPSQAEIMVRALEAKGLPYAYLAFEGEQHGFRRAENIVRSHEAELYFYSRVLGFELGDPVEAVDIKNL